MQHQLLQIYQQRIENLITIMKSIEEIVLNDPSMQYLRQQNLEKYRIDRFHQIIKDILSVEKQKIVVEVLVKYQELYNNTKNYQNYESHKNIMNFQKLDEFHNRQDNQIRQQKQTIQELKIQNQQLKLQIHTLRKQDEIIKKKIQKQLVGSQSIQQNYNNIIIELRSELETVHKQNNELKLQLIHKESQYSSNSSHVQCSKKIRAMKIQVMHLSEELLKIQRVFQFIKQSFSYNIMHQIKSLNRYFIQLKYQINHQLLQYKSKIMDIIKQCRKKNPMEQITLKMKQLDQQLNQFIYQTVNVEQLTSNSI